MTATTQREECTAPGDDRLLMAIELGRRQWKVGVTTQRGQRIRRRTLPADAWDRLPEEIAAAKKRLDLPTHAPVTSCDEAGRDGFWIHRYLVGAGVASLVVDSSSLEVNRRARRAKTDAIDLTKLLSMLRRHVGGEKKVWRVVHIPSAQDEERRQPHRELWALKRDRTRVTNRITGLLATVGVYVKGNAKFPTRPISGVSGTVSRSRRRCGPAWRASGKKSRSSPRRSRCSNARAGSSCGSRPMHRLPWSADS
jgi:transposase